MNRIGEKIRKLRKATGLSQRQSAEKLGISIAKELGTYDELNRLETEDIFEVFHGIS